MSTEGSPQGLTFTKEYRKALEMTQTFKEHIWIMGAHKMNCSFDRVSGIGNIFCYSCKKQIWRSDSL